MGIKMGMMMSNRSIFVMGHKEDHDDGSFTHIASSKGTEGFVESAEGKKIYGKNVVGTSHINYRHIVPYEDGCMWTSVSCMDMGGSIPKSVIGLAAGKMSKAPEKAMHFILTGEKLKD